MTTTSAPAIGTRVRAETCTPSVQNVVIEVTAVDTACDTGWYVWGYRQTRRRTGIRQTMYPRLYFVPAL